MKNCRTIKLNVINGQFNRSVTVLHKNSRYLKFIKCEIEIDEFVFEIKKKLYKKIEGSLKMIDFSS